MNCFSFELSGNTAHFSKPDVNRKKFTYSNIHKMALLGMLGAILGLSTYNFYKNDKDTTFKMPEYYEKLKNLKVAIIPLSDYGYFSKKFQIFNNATGLASKEDGGNFPYEEQWLENVKWKIYILVTEEDIELYVDLLNKLLTKQYIYLPYLGSNSHPAYIENVKEEKIKILNPNNFIQIDSLFTVEDESLFAEKSYEDNEYFSKEYLPISMSEEGIYQYKPFYFTNMPIQHNIENLFIDTNNNKTIYFI